MKYVGSKRLIAKHILPIILKDRKEGQPYIEPFVGGCNTIELVDGERIGNDFNEYLISLYIAFREGWRPPPYIDKELYSNIKNSKDSFPKELVGWTGICASYSGKWFGGHAGKFQDTSSGKSRCYQDESLRNLMKLTPKIKDVKLTSGDYKLTPIPINSLIYFDPPYKGTIKYQNEFNHNNFYNFVREKKSEGHNVFVSEYEMPEDFKCVWSGEMKSSLSANGKNGGNKITIEKLFTL